MKIDTIPAQLRKRHQWVLWSYEDRDGKTTKVLKRTSGSHASSTNPATWNSFDNVVAIAKYFDGIGFVFAPDDPYTGIDFDGVIDAETGEIDPAAHAMVGELASYTERSPSGTGIHVLIRAQLNGFPRHKTKKTPWGSEFEVYDQARFFTVTGERLNRHGIEPRQEELERVLAQIWPGAGTGAGARDRTEYRRGQADPVDHSVLEDWLLRPRFRALVERLGENEDLSARDFAVACFAVEQGAERKEVEKLIQAYRDDKKAMRADYLQRTVDKAFGHTKAISTEALDDLTKLLDLGDRLVLGADMFGRGSTALVVIRLIDGTEITLDPVGSYTNAARLTAELALQVGATPTLKQTDVHRILATIHRLAEVHRGFENEDRAADLATGFLARAEVLPVRMDNQAERWRAFSRLDKIDPVSIAREQGVAVASLCIVLKDRGCGLRYVRASWFEGHVRQHSGPGEARTMARSVLRLGWRRPSQSGQIKATAPGRRAVLHWAFFVVPEGWSPR